MKVVASLERMKFSSDAITFIYNPDEIGPYSLGSTELTIPYTTMSQILKSSFEP